MKKHLSTILLVLVFLTGLSVLLYPTVSNYVNSKSQSVAIASYVERKDQLDTASYDDMMAEAKAYNEQIKTDPGRFAIQGETKNQYLCLLGSNGGAVGYIEIDSIDVTLPIYLGDSPAVLKAGIGTMPGSSLPIGGAGTHSVLTGHRGLPSSKLFTNLDKVEVGDMFVLHILNEVLTYQVDQIRIVEPQDLSELEIQPEQDLCTLITCTPYGINTHRLLVRGHRIENSGQTNEINHHVTADAIQVDNFLVVSVLAVPLLLVLAVMVIWFLRDRKGPGKREKKKTRPRHRI